MRLRRSRRVVWARPKLPRLLVRSIAVVGLVVAPLALPSLVALASTEFKLVNTVPNTFGMGYSVAIDGDTAVLGAPQARTNGIQRGAAMVYTRTSGTWQLEDAVQRDVGFGFGDSVDISGDTLIVGSTSTFNSSAFDTATVYVRVGNTWTFQATLETGLDPAAVKIDGDTALVGTGDNAVHVFVRSGSTWTKQVRLVMPDRDPSDTRIVFGGRPEKMAIDGDTIVVGAPTNNLGNNTELGSAYVFTRSGAAWSPQTKLTRGALRFFGSKVALSGNTVLVGNYQFNRSGTTWAEGAPLAIPATFGLESFSVSENHLPAIDGHTAIVRAQSASYSFRRLGTSWVFQERLLPTDATPPDWLATLALSGDRVLAGAHRVGEIDLGDRLDAGPGAGFVFELSGVVFRPAQRTGEPASDCERQRHQPGLGSADERRADDLRSRGASDVRRSRARDPGAWGDDVLQCDGAERHVRAERPCRECIRRGTRIVERDGDRAATRDAAAGAPIEPGSSRHRDHGDLHLEPAIERRGCEQLPPSRGADTRLQRSVCDRAARAGAGLRRARGAAGNLLCAPAGAKRRRGERGEQRSLVHGRGAGASRGAHHAIADRERLERAAGVERPGGRLVYASRAPDTQWTRARLGARRRSHELDRSQCRARHVSRDSGSECWWAGERRVESSRCRGAVTITKFISVEHQRTRRTAAERQSPIPSGAQSTPIRGNPRGARHTRPNICMTHSRTSVNPALSRGAPVPRGAISAGWTASPRRRTRLA